MSSAPPPPPPRHLPPEPDSIAEILAAAYPEAWRRLQAEHVSDSTGHCRTCRSSSGASPVWPCNLRAIADEAQRITADRGGAPGTGGTRRAPV